MSPATWDKLELDGWRQANIALPAIGATFVVWLIYRILFDPLRSVPGPFAARISRFWELKALQKGGFPQTHVNLHKKYGSVVRIAPNRYSIADPEALKTIYGHGTKFTKSTFYHAFGDPDTDRADLFSERNIQRHAAKRRQVASLYSMTSLLSYEKFVDNCNAELGNKLRDFAAQGRVIDIPQWMQYYAFDVIGEISVGNSFGYMQKESDPRGILLAIHDSMVYGAHIGLFPELHKWLALMARTFHMKIPFDSVGDFINENIEGRKSGKVVGSPDDFLAKLLILDGSGKIDRLSVFTTLGANIAAGSDTTAISLSAIIYFLLKNPATLKKLRAEIDSFAEAGKISNPVSFQEAQRMPYLQAVIKEALRIHPATGQIMARIVPAEGAMISGRFFPGGTVVGSSAWVTHLDEQIFGKEAEKFRPERWLEDKSQVTIMDTNLFSFGAGARTCIGRNITMLEMQKLIPQIFRKYDFELAEPTQEWELDAGWFVKQKFTCRVKLRSD